jgi:hypothetical protein
VTQGRVAAGLGNELEELVFHNRGRPCLLRGYPTVSGVTTGGARRTLRPSRSGGGTYFGRLVPADMPRGGHTLLDFATGRVCEGGTRRGTTYRDLVFRLRNGGIVRAGKNVTITEVCGLSMSTFGLRPAPPRPPTPPPAAVGTLTATIAAPATIRAGDTLDYVITLANPTSVTVRLSPCPGYTQGIYVDGLVGRGSFALNCDTVQAIPPHQHVRYAMRLQVPNRSARVAKLGWSLNDPNGPFAGTALQVTPTAGTARATCPAALAGASGLGTVAFIRDAGLAALDVAGCRIRTLIAPGRVRGPVGWSGDGRWIAAGATVVSARGGPRLKPLPHVDGATAWSPRGHVLAGVTERGGVELGGPGMKPRSLLADGWGATTLAFSPTGRLLAVSRSLFPQGSPPYHQEISLVDWRSGRTREVFRVRKPNVAPPLLFGFSPDGRWLIAWQSTQNSASLMADGLPLVAIRLADGKAVAIGKGTLVYRDFLSWCGSALAYVVNRGGRQVTLGDRVALAGPPTWKPTLTHGRIHDSNSYNSPSCSPPRRFEIAAAVGPKTADTPFGREHRRIWLLDYTGGNWHPLGPAPQAPATDELPRWSADGRWIAFIRTTPTSKAGAWRGRLYLLDLSKRSNGRAALVGPVADVGTTGNYYGHYQWDSQLAWRTRSP